MDRIHDSASDPRHVFLTATDVMHRYGWGKTKGCLLYTSDAADE